MAWYSHLSLHRKARWWQLQERNSEQAASRAASVAITSMGLGSGSGIAVVELGDASTALGVVPCEASSAEHLVGSSPPSTRPLLQTVAVL